MMREAGKIGPATIALIEAVMKAKPHPEQAPAAASASCGLPQLRFGTHRSGLPTRQ